MYIVLALMALPWLASLLMLFLPKSLGRGLTILTAVVLSVLSFIMYVNEGSPLKFGLGPVADTAMLCVDGAMLLFFAYVAWRDRSWLVGTLTAVQALLFGAIIAATQGHIGAPDQFFVDKLSIFMYLLINVVSGIICIYALEYIDEEKVSEQRKRNFMATLWWFVGVMNFIVSVNNIEWFFLLFEATTLASFILIRFRRDDVSIANALRALWMNQLGGVAILVAILVAVKTEALGTVQFTELVSKTSQSGIMLPVALIALAAMVKGAQMPFSSWLLGAMVAPTPVSALLHSSTMVKIAPFVILRLSPALHGTTVSYVIMLSCIFVFLWAAIGALAKDNFKLILAQSTIALLSLMILLAAVGTESAIMAALLLVMFHGISKCLLFLEAGVLERVFHAKATNLEMQKVGEAGPWTVFLVAVGFLSLMLPPFGAFLGKWLGLESLSASAVTSQKFIGTLLVGGVAVGGAVLSFLYFRVMGGLFLRSGSQEEVKSEKMSCYYKYAPLALAVLLLVGVVTFVPLVDYYIVPVASAVLGQMAVQFRVDGVDLLFGSSRLVLWPMVGALVLLPLVLVLGNFVRFSKVDRVKEYTCGEKAEFSVASYYFPFERATPIFVLIGALFFAIIAVLGRFPL